MLSVSPNITKFLLPNITLTSYELEVLISIQDPRLVKYNFDQIGGLKDIKNSLLLCLQKLIYDNNDKMKRMGSGIYDNSMKTNDDVGKNLVTHIEGK